MAAGVPSTSENKLVVLTVDDEPILRALAETVLSDAGFEVLSASDATLALDILRGQTVDVLLTDIVLPGPLSGFDLAREAMTLIPNLKVVCTTSYASALDVGQTVLLKPYQPKQLIDAINQSLAT